MTATLTLQDLIRQEITLAREAEAEVAGLSFWDFCREVCFGENGILDSRELAPCHEELCRVYEERNVYLDQRTRLRLWPRGSLKTTIGTIAYPVWLILRNPDIRILIASATEKLSSKIIESIASLIRDRRFKARFGDWQDGGRFRRKDITVGIRRHAALKEPTISVASVETSEVGGHYDRILCDDIHDEKNVSTREQIEKVWRFYGLLTPLLEPKGEKEISGTRWDEADVYARIEQIIPPSCVSVRRVIDESGRNLWPEKYTPKLLADARKDLGTYGFNLQYQNLCTAPEDMVFKSEWLNKCLFREDKFPKMEQYYIACDPAISEARGADYTAMVVVGVDRNDCWYVVEAVNEHMSPTGIIDKLFELADRWRPVKAGIELVSFQAVLKNWYEHEVLRRLADYRKAVTQNPKNPPTRPHSFILDELKPGQRTKAKRIEGLYSRVEFTQLRWRPGYDLITDQFRRHRPDREQPHDDLIDAIAYLKDMIPPAVRGVVTTPASPNKRKINVVWAKDKPAVGKSHWYTGNFNQYRRVGA